MALSVVTAGSAAWKTGLALAGVAGIASLQPSLLPRSRTDQLIVSGASMAIAFGAGAGVTRLSRVVQGATGLGAGQARMALTGGAAAIALGAYLGGHLDNDHDNFWSGAQTVATVATIGAALGAALIGEGRVAASAASRFGARGGIGALVFNTWRGVSTVKVMKSPAQPRTARQLLVRGFLATCARAWAAVTAANKLTWTTWANDHPTSDWTGQPLRMTGADAYTRHTTRLLDQGKAVVQTAPVAAGPDAPAAVVCTPGAASVSIAFTAYAGTATSINPWLYGPFSKGISPKITKARHKSYAPGETTPLVITGLAIGHWALFMRAVSETDGQASTFVLVEFDVAS